jgi:Thioredoxin-like [2Fe-2S] ferredoxin
MSRQQQKRIRPLTGHFLGWGDDRTPHRYLKLATTDGDRLVKIAKSLRPHIQDWQPGMWLTLLSQEWVCRATGEHKIKVKQLLMSPDLNLSNQLPDRKLPRQIDPPSLASDPVVPTKIQVCQGSSCRRRGSEHICRSMQAYLDRANLTDQVKIETVKCLHQCKAAPHAIVTNTNLTGEILAKKTHYRQIQTSQVQALLAKHFPIVSSPEPTASNLIEKIGAYLQQHQISTAATIL